MNRQMWLAVGITAIIVGAGAYFYYNFVRVDIQKKDIKQQNPISEQTPISHPPEQSEPEQLNKDNANTPNPLVYTNQEYGFSLTFPESWKGINVDVHNFDVTPPTKIVKVVTFTSKADNFKSLDVYVVKNQDVKDPTVTDNQMTFIATGSKYTYYYASSGDCAGMPGCESPQYSNMLNEAKNIVKSFQLI